jgi:FkbM family methyltransferase
MKFQDIYYTSINKILRLYFEASASKEIFVIVIGANDGNIKDFLSDYLYKENVKGVLVEPIKHLFLGLREKYKDNTNFYFENSAIYKRNGKINMYRVNKAEHLPDWTQGLGSLSRKVIDYHAAEIENLGSHIVKEQVKCISFAHLVKKYNISTINILQIDTEGLDFEIIGLIDFNALRPDIIIFEFMHLTFYQYHAAINFLQKHNYHVSKNENSMDIIAIDNDVL